MPVLTTPDEIRRQLGGAIRDRDHYVFITDTDGGRRHLGRFLLGATSMFGVADAALLFSEFPFLVTSVGLTRTIAVLAVHKLAIPRWAVGSFVALFCPRGPLPAGADLFPVTDSNDPAFLAGVLDVIRRGEFFPVVPGAN